ncbi:MAG TPA: hypothetical protein VM733_05665 [Thermoanaerobaculia bacterium]|nr:hypothetical protein [Thermoanaerobaculia bacterium]
MILFLGQTAVLLAAVAALWLLWRVSERHSRRIGMLVAGAVFLRAAAGCTLFWIAYFRLPFARSLQLEERRGFWYFATDGLAYFKRALVAASDGPVGIVTMTSQNPSVVYNKVLAVFTWALGPIPSVGILLNVFAFLGIAAIVASWARRYDVGFLPTAVPIVAAGYSPSWVLWSVQPLKDAFFCFVIVLFAFAVDLWVRAWRNDDARVRRVAAAAALMALAMYALAGVRWYYALVALIAAFVPLAAPVFRRAAPASRRFAAGLVAAGVAVVLAQLIVLGAGPYLPDAMRGVLRLKVKPDSVAEVLVGSRRSFDSYKEAGTRIRVGPKLRETPPPAIAAAPPATTPATTPAPRPATTTAAPPPPADIPAHVPPPVAVAEKPVQPSPPMQPSPPVHVQPAPPVQPAPKPAVVNPVDEDAAQSDVPRTWQARAIAGVTALLLPHSIGEGLGLISLGGGRGFWWFADVDTIFFNVLLFTSLGLLVAARKTAWRDPFVWYILAVSFAIAGALAYTVSNYGTLFRHRSMILAAVVLLPIAAYRSRSRAAEAAVVERNHVAAAPDDALPTSPAES